MEYEFSVTPDVANPEPRLPPTTTTPYKVMKQTREASGWQLTPPQEQEDIEMGNAPQKPKRLSGVTPLFRFMRDGDPLATPSPKRTLQTALYRRFLFETAMDVELTKKRKIVDAEEHDVENKQPGGQSAKALGKRRAKRPRQPDMYRNVRMCVCGLPDHGESSMEMMDWDFDCF